MTNFPTGDNGQRYEVRFYVRDTGEEKVMGWTNEPDGGSLLEAAKLWPHARDPFVIDRRKP
jgi:hypothetical protein